MNILIAGATGFIGHELVAVLAKEHTITVLGRDWLKLQQHFNQEVTIATWEMLPKLKAQSFDLIINLCGKNIAESRWNMSIKEELIESRVDTSAILIQWAIDDNAKPRFFCANAIGIYGIQDIDDSTVLDEDSPVDFDPPKDFLNEIGQRWQQALQPAIDFGIPVTTTRFAVVLKKNEGMLKKLYLSYYLGAGSILGDGRQVISWVDYQDLVAAFQFLIAHPEITGPVNISSPYPISQEEFARTLATIMNRPLFLKIPQWLVKKMFGEMGEALLLGGQCVYPKRLLAAGFEFRYPKLLDALTKEL